MDEKIDDIKKVDEIEEVRLQINQTRPLIESAQLEMAKVIIGQEEMIESIMIALLSSGHLLLEGLPGLAKTLSVKVFARVVETAFQRVQFTPDLLPADLIGTMVFDPKSGDFRTKKGPIFTNIMLADEINRAPAKVQSALLQAMEEKEVTIGEQSYALPDPFLVMATENPIDQEGTYPLPEAQSDRFLMKLLVSYPSIANEKAIVSAGYLDAQKAQTMLSIPMIQRIRSVVQSIYVDEKLVDYAVNLAVATRPKHSPQQYAFHQYIEYGASPRASINLIRAAKARAFMSGREFIKPDDIQAIAHRILRHRIILTYEAEADGKDSDEIISDLLNSIPVP